MRGPPTTDDETIVGERLAAAANIHARDCQKFRVWAMTMRAEETSHGPHTKFLTVPVTTDVEHPVAKHLIQIEERRTQSTSNLPADSRLPHAAWSEENDPVPTLRSQYPAPM
jgi:hypothetical protein